jgi:ATP/maltotriose-dependent transcriptional regulator MalT
VDSVVRTLEADGQAERNTDVYLGSRYFRLRVIFESDRLEEAEADALDIYARATQMNNRTMFCAATSILANVALLRGDPAKALEWAQLGLPVAEQIQNLAASRGSGAVLILARADLGDHSAEPSELDRLERGLFASGDLGINSDTIVEAFLEVGELRRARRVADARVERSGGRLREVRGALMSGFVALAHGPGEHAVAERAFGEALAGAVAVGARSLEGRAHLGLAELAKERGDSRPMESHARQALAILRALGFDRYAGRAAALLLERLEGAPPNA